ncbi:MAG: HNH endonuclease [Candidatus Gastranaerophilaceae bacterium]
MEIAGKQYTFIETKEKMTVPDCFVLFANKIGGGHGEAKFYVGNDSEDLRSFFGPKGFQLNCFLLKKDLLKYMEDCKPEYENPEQPYQKKQEMPRLWKERVEKIKQLQDIIYFNLAEQTQIAGPRVYVNSSNSIYKLIREISLPNITYLASIKLKDKDNHIYYYFRLFVDYFGEIENKQTIDSQVKEIEESEDTSSERKLQLTTARIGQGKYRQDLLNLCPFCPITLVSDDRLLIASHIKPWAKSNEDEKIDPYNGFMFTPNIDLLFDRGFITFTNDKKNACFSLAI